MLTPDQARTLWDAGGFALLQGLPAGSDAGIDGTYHAVRAFAGHKFVPPGFHLLVWGAVPGKQKEKEEGKEEEGVEEIATPGAEAAAAASASDLATAFPVRTAYAHHFSPRERLKIQYDPITEKSTITRVDDAALPSLDAMLAPYPFAGLEGWKALSSAISAAVVHRVTAGKVIDSLTPEQGGSDDIAVLREAARRAYSSETETETEEKDEFKLAFPVFELKRSAPAGAEGDALSRWSRDKSALLGKVCAEVGGPRALLGHVQLAFLLVTQVWNFAALGAYKRLVGLLCRSPAAFASPGEAELGLPATEMRETALALLATLRAQIAALPNSAESEIPDLDKFFATELEALRRALGGAMAEREWWALAPQVAAAWSGLQREARKRGWELEDVPAGDEDSDEEGEYAPVVVDTEDV